MRLIDADELIVMEYGGIKFVPKEFIDDAPTIEERKKATWERVKGADGIDFRCSACHKFRFHNGELRRYKFCPNCGADMREDSDG